MSDQRAEAIAELRRKFAAATSGEWEFRHGNDRNGDSCDLLMVEIGHANGDEDPEYAEVLFGQELGDVELQANWEFIVASHNHMPALLDALESALETVRVLSDNNLVMGIAKSLEDVKLGRCVPLEQVDLVIERDAEIERLKARLKEIADSKAGRPEGMTLALQEMAGEGYSVISAKPVEVWISERIKKLTQERDALAIRAEKAEAALKEAEQRAAMFFQNQISESIGRAVKAEAALREIEGLVAQYGEVG